MLRRICKLLTGASLVCLALAKGKTAKLYTDPASGIVFDTWNTGGPILGMVLPANALTHNATEFIGLISCQNSSWCGMSLGGRMTESLLIVAYAQGSNVRASLRLTTSFSMPLPYTETPATLTGISQSVTPDGFTVVFRCQNCFSWSSQGVISSADTSTHSLQLAWAVASSPVTSGDCTSSAHFQQHYNQAIFPAALNKSTVSIKYASWAKLAVTDLSGCVPPPSSLPPLIIPPTISLLLPSSLPQYAFYTSSSPPWSPTPAPTNTLVPVDVLAPTDVPAPIGVPVILPSSSWSLPAPSSSPPPLGFVYTPMIKKRARYRAA